MQPFAEDYRAANAVPRRGVLTDDHVVSTRSLGTRLIIHPARLEEFELVLDRRLYAEEQQAALGLVESGRSEFVLHGRAVGHADA